jgi:hypothetical protein
LVNWLTGELGELVEVKILSCRQYLNHCLIDHMLVECSDGTRKYVLGHQGDPGETIKVYTSQIHIF